MYNIRDKLTSEEFNGIISILRHFTEHKETIIITDTVNGEFGDYEFKLVGSTILDTGIVISEETLTSQPQIRLSNPAFKSSNYTLHLTILHYTGVNVLDDVTGDYKVVEHLDIPLTVNEWVDIPLESLDADYIISLDATVEINHNKTEVVENETYLTLRSDKDILSSYDHDTATITAKLYSEDPVGQTITFKAYHDDTLVTDLGSAVTDENGECSVTYSATGVGDVEILAECQRIFVSKTYEVRDVWYYATEQKIKDTFTALTWVSGRTIYKKPLSYVIDDLNNFTLEFKLSNFYSSSLSAVIGIDMYGEQNFDIRCGNIVTTNMGSYYSSSITQKNRNGSTISASASSVYKIKVVNGVATWYKDDVQYAQYTVIQSSTSQIRYDLMNSNPSHIEYIIIS